MLALAASAGVDPSERWVDGVARVLVPEPAPADLAIDAVALADDGRSFAEGRWRRLLADYALDDLRSPPVAGGIVFIGSSSIRQWTDIASTSPRRHVVARGLGGSHLADCTRFVDRLVVPHRPQTVVVYAGDNDLADGASPDQVADDFARLVARLRDLLPDVRVVFISIKPSLARDALLPKIQQTNGRIADFASRQPGVSFVDVYAPMLGPDGHARASLFDPDGLHLNAEGYDLWRETLSRHLETE